MITDAGWPLEDGHAGAVAVAVPGTQQAASCCPSSPQSVPGLLLQVLGVVVHSRIVPNIPAAWLIIYHFLKVLHLIQAIASLYLPETVEETVMVQFLLLLEGMCYDLRGGHLQLT